MLRLVSSAALVALVACAPPPPPAVAPPPVVPAPAPPPPPPAAPTPPPPPPLPLAELELATHRAFFAALRAHDPKALAALYTPDATIAGFDEAHDAAGFVALAESAWAAFPDSRIQWRTLAQDGDTLAVELAWTGTHASTHKVSGANALVFERFAPTGQIAEQRVYLDEDAVVADVGSRTPSPHPFTGLPTLQTNATQGQPPSEANAATVTALTAALAARSRKELARLGDDETIWVDESRRHAVYGKEALATWASFLARTFPEGSKLARVAAGDVVTVEWNDGVDARAHGGDVIVLRGGKVLTVRSYVRSPRTPDKARGAR